MDFKAEGLKILDIRFKFVSFQCSWVKTLCDDCFHEWKIIPLHLLSSYFGSSFKFHFNLHFEGKVSEDFPPFYKQMLVNWKICFIAPPTITTCVMV